MEVTIAAGLALGVIGVLPAACAAIRCCIVLFESFRHFDLEIEHCIQSLMVQERLFLWECQLLLDDVVADLSIAEAMVANVNHPTWSEPWFWQTWEDIFEEEFDFVIRHMQQSLDSLRSLLKKAVPNHVPVRMSPLTAGACTNLANTPDRTRHRVP